MPAYVGPRGWVGLRLDVGRVSWGEVKELVGMSYELVAGKKRRRFRRLKPTDTVWR